MVIYLTHDIHLDDKTADNCLKTLHSIRRKRLEVENFPLRSRNF